VSQLSLKATIWASNLLFQQQDPAPPTTQPNSTGDILDGFEIDTNPGDIPSGLEQLLSDIAKVLLVASVAAFLFFLIRMVTSQNSAEKKKWSIFAVLAVFVAIVALNPVDWIGKVADLVNRYT
jgi:hypothetical protein